MNKIFISTTLSVLFICLSLSSCSFQTAKSNNPILLDSRRSPPEILIEKNITVTRTQLNNKLSRSESARLVEVFHGVEYVERYPRYRVFDVKPTSALALLGFKNGDVLEGAAGYVIKDTSAFAKYISILPSLNEAVFDIVRAGQPMKLRIKIQ